MGEKETEGEETPRKFDKLNDFFDKVVIDHNQDTLDQSLGMTEEDGVILNAKIDSAVREAEKVFNEKEGHPGITITVVAEKLLPTLTPVEITALMSTVLQNALVGNEQPSIEELLERFGAAGQA